MTFGDLQCHNVRKTFRENQQVVSNLDGGPTNIKTDSMIFFAETAANSGQINLSLHSCVQCLDCHYGIR